MTRMIWLRSSILILAAALIASEAGAHSLSQTDGFTRVSEDGVMSFLLLNQMREQNAESDHLRRRQLANEQEARLRREEREDLAKRVGRRIANGECESAKRLALNEGDFVMAERVVTLCAQPKVNDAR